jgi:uncharacterized Zn finger protein
MEKHYEIIKCPECGRHEVAEVLHTVPWYTYIHNCTCGYIIMESELDKITMLKKYIKP